MLRLSSYESRNWNAEVRPITFSPGNCESAVIRSSEIPSETYCWLASPLSFASGFLAELGPRSKGDYRRVGNRREVWNTASSDSSAKGFSAERTSARQSPNMSTRS